MSDTKEKDIENSVINNNIPPNSNDENKYNEDEKLDKKLENQRIKNLKDNEPKGFFKNIWSKFYAKVTVIRCFIIGLSFIYFVLYSRFKHLVSTTKYI